MMGLLLTFARGDISMLFAEQSIKKVTNITILLTASFVAKIQRLTQRSLVTWPRAQVNGRGSRIAHLVHTSLCPFIRWHLPLAGHFLY